MIERRAARLDQERGGDAVARRHAAEIERFLDVLRVALPGGKARRGLRGIGQEPAHLLRRKPGHASRRRR
jgi:hypothetical protein